jgi:urea transporter
MGTARGSAPAGPSAWSRLAEGSSAVRFLDVNLRGAGQVVLQDNPLSGLCFLAAVAWGAIEAGAPEVAVGAIVALAVSTLTAMLLGADGASLRLGLFGFNGLLVGAALATFLADTPAMWFLLLVGAAVSTVAMLAVTRVMSTWDLPALTFPFLLTTWLLLLAAHAFGGPAAEGMGPPPPAGEPVPAAPDWAAAALLAAWLKGPAQVFLIDSWRSGIIVLFGLAVASLPAAGFALLGSGVGLAVALALGASPANVSAGLHGFSPVLTAVAVGCTFQAPSWRAGLHALLAIVFAVVAQGALDAGFSTFGLPALTAPFVVVTWLFLLAQAELAPTRD